MGRTTTQINYQPMPEPLDRIIAVIERNDAARAVLNQDLDGCLDVIQLDKTEHERHVIMVSHTNVGTGADLSIGQ
jgi:hypothetical protein